MSKSFWKNFALYLLAVIVFILILWGGRTITKNLHEPTCIRGGYAEWQMILDRGYCVGYDLEGRLMVEEYRDVVERIE